MEENAKWTLVTRYISGEADNVEMKEIEKINKPEDKKLVNDLKDVQKMIDDYKKMRKVDVDKAWNNVFDRISATQSFEVRKERRIIPLFVKIAASVAVIIGIFYTYRIIYNDNYLTAYSSDNNTVVTLPDGSKVYLNADSRVKYPSEFSSDSRKIILTGEAFFEVTPDKKRPFIVSTGESVVKVLGTSFLVKNSENKVKVYVETGKVSFYKEGLEESGILLNPGELGTLEKNSLTTERNANRNILAWKTKKIVFTNETFSEIAEVLEDVYNINIEVKNAENGNCLHAVKFVEGQTLNDVLNVLGTEAYNFTIHRSQNKIIIDLAGCK